MTWVGFALIALGGFLIGGVVSLWRSDARVAATVVGLFAAGALIGGVAWLIR